MTPALSSKYKKTPSLRRQALRCRMTTAGMTGRRERGVVRIKNKEMEHRSRNRVDRSGLRVQREIRSKEAV
jgi:hypothetical protein